MCHQEKFVLGTFPDRSGAAAKMPLRASTGRTVLTAFADCTFLLSMLDNDAVSTKTQKANWSHYGD